MNLKCSTVKTIRSATVSRFVTSAPSHQKITNIPFKYVEVKRNKTQIKTLIDNDFTYYLMTLEQKGYKILEKNVKMKIVGDTYIGKGQVTVVQPFGSLEELSISEEGTTVNERD